MQMQYCMYRNMYRMQLVRTQSLQLFRSVINQTLIKHSNQLYVSSRSSKRSRNILTLVSAILSMSHKTETNKTVQVLQQIGSVLLA
jgi:hypothetical protein